MNRRYIDFVPNKNAVREPAMILPEKTPPVITPKPAVVAKPVAAPKPTVQKIKSEKIAMKPSAVMGKGFVQEALKKKVIQRKKEAPVEKKPTEEDKILQEALDKADNLAQPLRVPQTRFVNTEKIVKRPLSKNVYQKKIETPKEVEQAPVTIIAKPERDSKVGIVVTVIITIILGAAAGTVAFLLLPK